MKNCNNSQKIWLGNLLCRKLLPFQAQKRLLRHLLVLSWADKSSWKHKGDISRIGKDWFLGGQYWEDIPSNRAMSNVLPLGQTYKGTYFNMFTRGM